MGSIFQIRSGFSIASWMLMSGWAWGWTSPAIAQPIQSDGSLGTSIQSGLMPTGQVQWTIENGTSSGSTLFHSFQRFSVPQDSIAFFNSNSNITTIFGRVTGGVISQIDGTLKTLPNTSLFLLNPAGVIFGANAKLEIGGSFWATSAQSVLFPDQKVFSADINQPAPILTVNLPIGLQWGNSPGAIEVQQASLQVNPGKTLGLLGNGVTLVGNPLTPVPDQDPIYNSQILVPNGHLEIGSVGTGAMVQLVNGLNGGVNYQTATLNDLRLSRYQVISGDDLAGSLNLTGENLSIDESQIMSRTIDQNSQFMYLNAKNHLSFKNSQLLSTTTGTGNAADLRLQGNSIEIDSFKIDSTTFGAGQAGDVEILGQSRFSAQWGDLKSQSRGKGDTGNVIYRADDVNLLGLGTGVEAYNQGDANTVLIEAKDFYIQWSGLVANTFSTGRGGNMTINADNVTVFEAGVGVDTLGEGDAGTLRINSRRLYTEGAGVFAGTSGAGNGGSVVIRSDEVIVGLNSAIIATSEYFENSVRSTEAKVGGAIDIVARRVYMPGDAGIIAYTTNNNHAGDIRIQAETVEVGNGAKIDVSSDESGDAGDIQITAKVLDLRNGARVQSATRKTGAGGQIDLTIDEVRIAGVDEEGGSAKEPTGIFALTRPDSQAPGGSIALRGRVVELSHGALISASSYGTKSGGDIDVTVDRLSLTEGSQILSTAHRAGNAGNIQVNAKQVEISGQDVNFLKRLDDIQKIEAEMREKAIANNEYVYDFSGQVAENPYSGIFGGAAVGATGSSGSVTIQGDRILLENQGQMAVSNAGTGNGGNITLQANRIDINNAGLYADTQAGDRGNIAIRSDVLWLRNGRISTNATGSANGGNIFLNADSFVILNDRSLISANAKQGQGGNITIQSKGIFVLPGSQITASSELGQSGQVNLITIGASPSLSGLTLPRIDDQSGAIQDVCRSTQGSSFVITGRGGLPHNPADNKTKKIAPRSWSDLRLPTSSGVLSTSQASAIESMPAREIVEATQWVKNTDGSLELVAPIATQRQSAVTCAGL